MSDYCTLEQISEVTESTKDVVFTSNDLKLKFKIGKITNKTIQKMSDDNEAKDSTMLLISEGVVAPVITMDTKLPADIMTFLAKKINEFSGLDKLDVNVAEKN